MKTIIGIDEVGRGALAGPVVVVAAALVTGDWELETGNWELGTGNWNWDLAFALAYELAQMSLFAVGGATSVIPDLHRRIVENRGWATESQFNPV